MNSVPVSKHDGEVDMHVVGVGGTLAGISSTDKALRAAMREVRALGARTTVICGAALDLPIYRPAMPLRTNPAKALVDALRSADAVIFAAPVYHGGISGLVKNVLDYTEDLRADARPYLRGRAVGLIATGAGWQGAVGTLASLRNIVHALRGWPTPLGIAINTSDQTFDAEGNCINPKIQNQFEILAEEIIEFGRSNGPGTLAQQVPVPVAVAQTS